MHTDAVANVFMALPAMKTKGGQMEIIKQKNKSKKKRKRNKKQKRVAKATRRGRAGRS